MKFFNKILENITTTILNINNIMAANITSPRPEFQLQNINVNSIVCKPWFGQLMMNTVCHGCNAYSPWQMDQHSIQPGCPRPTDYNNLAAKAYKNENLGIKIKVKDIGWL